MMARIMRAPSRLYPLTHSIPTVLTNVYHARTDISFAREMLGRCRFDSSHIRFRNRLPVQCPLRVTIRGGEMAEIIHLRPAQAGGHDPIFKAVCEMEGDLRAIDEFADALTLVSETMDESPHANAINRLAWEIKRRGETAEKRRQDLSLLVNPDRSQDP